MLLQGDWDRDLKFSELTCPAIGWQKKSTMEYSTRKALAIKEYLAGGTTSAKLGKKYGFGNASVSRWVVEEKKEKGQYSAGSSRKRLSLAEE